MKAGERQSYSQGYVDALVAMRENLNADVTVDGALFIIGGMLRSLSVLSEERLLGKMHPPALNKKREPGKNKGS